MILLVLFFESSQLIKSVLHFPIGWLVLHLIFFLFVVLDLRLEIFIGVALDVREIVSVHFPPFPFELEHILLHDSLFVCLLPLDFVITLQLISQLFHLRFELFEFYVIELVLCLPDHDQLVFIDALGGFDLVGGLVDLEVYVDELGLYLVQNILIVGALVHLELLHQFFVTVDLLVCVIKLPPQGWQRFVRLAFPLLFSPPLLELLLA
jgi:hypothetical protein